jgi:hypothetical protein
MKKIFTFPRFGMSIGDGLVLLFIMILAFVFVGCAGYPVASKTVIPEENLKADVFEKASEKNLKTEMLKRASEKKRSILDKMYEDIMENGELISRKADGDRYADGTEVTVETWTVKSKKDTYLIIWENGVLSKIKTVKKKKDVLKPLGSN